MEMYSQSIDFRDISAFQPFVSESPRGLSRLFRYTSLFTGARAPTAEPERVIVLIAGHNPSFDYFLAPRVDVDAKRSWTVVDTRRTLPSAVDWVGAYVIVCRYLGPVWLSALKRAAPRLTGIGLFLDDDFVAFAADESVPTRYRLRIVLNGVWIWGSLSPLLSRVWFSAGILANRYWAASGAVITPIPSDVDLQPQPHPMRQTRPRKVRIAYHAKSSHLLDHEFAAMVARLVARRRPNAVFDVIADGKAKSFWRDVPNVHIRGPLAWRKYRRLAETERYDVHISPLIPTELNDARAPTKAIDAVRFSAAGIFADVPAYESLAGAAALLPPNLEAWADEIVSLIDDSEKRGHAAATLRTRVASWRNHCEPLGSIAGN